MPLICHFIWFCRTKNTEEPDQGDQLKNICNDEDKKQRLDTLWATFKDGTDTKEVKDTVMPSSAKPTTSKVYRFAGEEVK